MSWVWAALVACGTSEYRPIAGSAVRIGQPVPAEGTELELKIFTEEMQCRATVKPDEVEQCLPWVDRASGEVRLAFQLRLDSDDFPLPLQKEHIQIAHLGTLIQDDVGGQAYDLVPHDPTRAPQLFILLIDGSSSMAESSRGSRSRMDEVRAALLLREVQDAFFPKGVKTGVVLLTFTNGEPEPLGGELVVLDNKQDYARLVRDELAVRSGYTHLYDAIAWATGPLLDRDEIRRYIDLYQAAPTVVALTDGFNNVSQADICRDNAPRLDALLQHLDGVRGAEDTDIRTRPTVYTVGLGRPLQPSFQLPEQPTSKVRPSELCGTRHLDSRIDGDLERWGIDNVSLELVAERAGGFAYVRQDRRGLGEAFASAAAERYYWFEARYRLDPFFLRRVFKTTIRLESFAEAESTVEIVPSAWFDTPPGERGEDGWARPRPLRHTVAIVLPILGLLVTAAFTGASWFNFKRAVLRRR